MAMQSSFNCATHTPLPVQDHAGRSYCYNCVIETFQSQAYNLARRMLNDWALAEDALQESFTSGYRSFRSFRGDNLKAWIMQIVANTCRDMLRTRKAHPTVPLDPLPGDPQEENPAPSVVDLPSSYESPEDYAERQELRQAIEDGLSSLSEEQRLVVLLVDVQGMSYEEAAQVMTCSLGTVKSRISRGRSSLRDFLRARGELLPSRFRQDK
jgi:RNA polymerase sigma-70 factor (ECF subfamily)